MTAEYTLTISDFIEALQQAREFYGDLEVYMTVDGVERDFVIEAALVMNDEEMVRELHLVSSDYGDDDYD